jgi:hypothetical protein
MVNLRNWPRMAKTISTWASDVQIVFGSKKLKASIGLGNKDEVATDEQNDQALYFLRHHLSPTLKNEYMTERKANDLWTALKNWFEMLKYTILPRAQQDWARLRFADFKSVAEYNSALHLICTNLSLCGKNITKEEKIEKNLSTFHPSAIQSAHNYRQDAYKLYNDLIDIMQVVEAKALTLKSMLAPTRSKNSSIGRGESMVVTREKTKPLLNVLIPMRRKDDKKRPQQKPYGLQEQTCYKCGVWGHWSKICRSPKHIVDAYKAKKNKAEAHFTMAITNEEAIMGDLTPKASYSPLDIASAVKMIASEENTSMVEVDVDTDAFLDSI